MSHPSCTQHTASGPWEDIVAPSRCAVWAGSCGENRAHVFRHEFLMTVLLLVNMLHVWAFWKERFHVINIHNNNLYSAEVLCSFRPVASPEAGRGLLRSDLPDARVLWRRHELWSFDLLFFCGVLIFARSLPVGFVRRELLHLFAFWRSFTFSLWTVTADFPWSFCRLTRPLVRCRGFVRRRGVGTEGLYEIIQITSGGRTWDRLKKAKPEDWCKTLGPSLQGGRENCHTLIRLSCMD